MQHAPGDAWERSRGPCTRRVSDGQVEPFRRAAGAVLRPCTAALAIALVIELQAVLQGRAAALAGVRSAR
ncbi:hypothetical protein BRL95_03755 [Xanthomonas oryzae pv. oryzae]|nr:hypothetical protein BRL95_03755 [Xanthomonas oryzae pv. oryzae]